MKLVGKAIGVIIMLCVLAFIGTCAWQNCRGKDPGPESPSVDKAQYSVTIKVTGVVYYTDKISTEYKPGFKVVTMYGYWEITKDKYIYHDITLPLDEEIFGPIEVRKR